VFAHVARPVTIALVALALLGCGSTGRVTSAGTPVVASSAPTATQPEQRVVVTRAVPFAAPGGVSLSVDIYHDEGVRNAAPVVLLHSGGWSQGSREDLEALATQLARHGLVVFAGDVRLSCTDPEPLCGAKYPVPLEDARSLIRFAREHAAAYGARVGPVGAFGLSSGAELALLAALTGSGPNRPGAVVAWSAPTSLMGLAHGPAAQFIAAYLGCTLARCPDRWRDASPSSHVSATAPPTLLVSSEGDTIVPAAQSKSLYGALRAAGGIAELEIEPGEDHADFGPDAIARSADFLVRHLT
jgi:acetyl esterase/lipase